MPVEHPPISISRRVHLPCYRHLEKSDYDIEFLYGGRDSGKTREIAMRLIFACLKLDYFRCVLVRKTFNTIKESQWQIIKDVVEEWGLSHLFKFSITPLEIHCVNGNKFVCRGMDDPGNLRSIANPNYCWAEEGNQLELTDFIMLVTSLRYNKARVKTFISFNPEAVGDYEEFWLYKTFYKTYKTKMYGIFDAAWEISVPDKFGKTLNIRFTYRSTWTTYKDNPHVRPERIAMLEQMEAIDPYFYTVFTLGFWGNQKVTDPYCYAFSEKDHVAETKPMRNFELILSFDFNINPITVNVIQEQGLGHIRGIEAVKLENSDIYKLCNYIKTFYPGYIYKVTGDATGRATSALVQDGMNYYTIIKAQLKLMDGQIKVPTVNPPVDENRVLVNACFVKADIKVDPVKCKALIFDFKNVSVTDLGKIDKGTRTDPKKRADNLDGWRYYLNMFQRRFLKDLK